MAFLTYLTQIDWHFPWLLCLQLPISISLYFLFLNQSKHKTSAWGFLFETQNNINASTLSEKKLNWKPYCLANLCFIPIITLLAGPYIPQNYHVILHDNYIIKHISTQELKTFSQNIINQAQSKNCNHISLHHQSGKTTIDINRAENLIQALLNISRKTQNPQTISYQLKEEQYPFITITGMNSKHAQGFHFLPYSQKADQSGINSITLHQNKYYRIKIYSQITSQTQLKLKLNEKALKLNTISKDHLYADIPINGAEGKITLEPFDQLAFNNTYQLNQIKLIPLQINDPYKLLHNHNLEFLKTFQVLADTNFKTLSISNNPEKKNNNNPTLIILNQKFTNNNYTIKKFGINQSLFLNSSSHLAQSTRHQLFAWPLDEAPEYYIESQIDTPLMQRDNKSILSLFPNNKIITTLDINTSFKNKNNQHKLLALIISSLNIRNLDKPLYLYEQTISNKELPSTMKLDANQFIYGDLSLILTLLFLSTLFFILFNYFYIRNKSN